MRLLYNVMLYAAAPFALALQLLRSFLRDPGYRERLGERFGFGPAIDDGCIWIHAVSVGEIQAAVPLVRRLLARPPERRMLLTTVTPTGYARGRQLFGDQVDLRYAPFDLPGSVRRFFDRARPRLAMILETELWPNLYAECGRRRVPLVLASARVSLRSIGRYRLMVPLFRETLSHGIVIAAQSAVDAERFHSIGASPARTHVTGNIKFDYQTPPEVEARGARWREAQAAGRPVWVAGSTHNGEETILLDAHRRLLATRPNALLLLAPRHPQRFDTVGDLLAKRGFGHVRRSTGAPVRDSTAVLLVDTLGELMSFYAAADVAFVGGSLVPFGGHNLLEPASLGRPVLIGPHYFNSEAITQPLLAAGAVQLVHDARDLERELSALFSSGERRRTMAAAGRAVLDANRGALDRLLTLVEPLL